MPLSRASADGRAIRVRPTPQPTSQPAAFVGLPHASISAVSRKQPLLDVYAWVQIDPESRQADHDAPAERKADADDERARGPRGPAGRRTYRAPDDRQCDEAQHPQ